MLGALLVALLIVVVLPSLLILSGMAAAAMIGWLLHRNSVDDHEGSELIDLNR